MDTYKFHVPNIRF